MRLPPGLRRALAALGAPEVSQLVAALAGIALLVWGGLSAARAADVRVAELDRARSTLATFAQWRRRFQPAVAAESIAWRRTQLELQDLGVIGDERLALTRSVARAAEISGLRDVRVHIQGPDTTGSDARLSTDRVRRHAAQFGLQVEGRGSLQAVAAFLGALPPSVAATDLSLVRQDGRARHRITLAVFELQLSHGNSRAILWSPVERGDSRRSGDDRAGG
jgi:hypothetical protein